MEQIKGVDEYYSRFLPYSHRFDNSTALKNFLNGSATYIHREIIFDDPKNLCEAFQLAKFYEEQWMNPLSDLSKPNIPSQSQIQSQNNSSTTLQHASTAVKTDLEFQAQNQTQIQIQIRNSNAKSSDLEIQEDEVEFEERSIYYESDDRSAMVVVRRPPPEPPDLESLVVGDGESTSAKATRIHSGAEDDVVAKGNVDTDVATSSTARTAVPERKLRETTGSRRFSAFRSGVSLWPVKGAENSVSGSAEVGAVAKEKGEVRGAPDPAVKSHVVAAMTNTEHLTTSGRVLRRV
ncbi:hypothetical protein PIB30_021793 [Stylosanthes scabra]|uniref:Uncharacterized protein n=1 Tax=Stylosanthes scabra TaxID=79078 RepID=A0ABU6VBB6_9FABA|nr:hypothetical protein [Stylosanthes scabra]